MLLFYLELLDAQEPIYRQALTAGWGVAAGGNGAPSFDLARLPVAELLPGFRRFLDDVAPAATEVLALVADALRSAPDEVPARLLEGFLERHDPAELAAELGCDPVPLGFFPWAFLAPVAEALAAGGGAAPQDAGHQTCPLCGRPPQVGVLRDEPEVKGRRYLVCCLCGTWWPYRRSCCAACGEPEKLDLHVSETTPHLRLEECRACRAYLKSVDLRQDGHAVPVVDDLASVELDLWAGERGLRKIQRNLLGL